MYGLVGRNDRERNEENFSNVGMSRRVSREE